MLNEWSDRVPPQPATWRNRLRHSFLLILLAVMVLAVGGGLVMQSIGWLRHTVRWFFA